MINFKKIITRFNNANFLNNYLDLINRVLNLGAILYLHFCPV